MNYKTKANLVLCKKCQKNYHDPKYQSCYYCSGKKPVECLQGCEKHLNDPHPATCMGCMEAKRKFFSTNKAYTD